MADDLVVVVYRQSPTQPLPQPAEDRVRVQGVRVQGRPEPYMLQGHRALGWLVNRMGSRVKTIT